VTADARDRELPRRPAVRAALVSSVMLGIVGALIDCGPKRFEGLTDGFVEAGPRDVGPPVRIDAAPSCFEYCHSRYGAGLLKERPLVDCLTRACLPAGVCDVPVDAGFDGGFASDGGPPSCREPLASPLGEPCERCIAERCCTEWDTCFDDRDCRALEECYFACPQ
jgi:hypothetical protein